MLEREVECVAILADVMCCRTTRHRTAKGLNLGATYFMPSPNTRNGEEFNSLGPTYFSLANFLGFFHLLSCRK